MTLSDLAALTGLGWDTVKDIVKARLEKDYGQPRLKELKRLSIDEIYVGRRRKFYTLVIDLDSGRVVWVAHGRGGDTLRKFWRALRLSKARIEAVSMDLSPAYQKGVRETCRNAQVVFDKFHVIAHANQAGDQVRRAEVRLGGAGVWEALRRSQWLWRKNPENLTESEQARLATLKNKQLATAKAYPMRLVLQDIYRSVSAPVARRRFRVWCRWVRWAARHQPRNLLRSMVKVAGLVEQHLTGILAHWKWGVTNAFLEGLNSVFSATKRKARGYRSTTHLITMLYFTAGKLRLPQF